MTIPAKVSFIGSEVLEEGIQMWKFTMNDKSY